MAVEPVNDSRSDQRVSGQRRSRLGAAARDDLQHVGRQHVLQQLDDPHDRQRVLLRRLEDDGVAGRQRRGALGRGVDRRPVERDDPADDAVRLVDGVAGDRAEVEGVARHLVGQAAVELEGADAELDVERAGLAVGLAHLQRLERGQLVGVLPHDPGAGEEQLAPLPGGEVAPHLVVGPPGPADGGVDLGRPASIDRGDHLAGGGIEDVERVVGPARRPGALERRQRRGRVGRGSRRAHRVEDRLAGLLEPFQRRRVGEAVPAGHACRSPRPAAGA